MTHVLLISEWRPPDGVAQGGLQVGAERLARALLRAGARVSVLAPSTLSDASGAAHEDGDMAVFRVTADDRWLLLRLLRPWRRRAHRVIETIGADIVHGQGLILGGLAAADARNVPRVVTAHGNARADTLAAYRGVSAATRAAIRQHLARGVVRSVDAIVGVHPDWTINVPLEPSRFVYIPNIVDDHYYTSHAHSVPGLVVFAGGSRAIKGWCLLAEAWPAVRRAVHDACLVVAGWPSGKVVPGIAASDQGSLRLRTASSPTEMAELLGHASAIVVPSQFEVAPLLIAEAWAVGVPVVATAVGGIPSLAEGAAILVEPGSSVSLAEGLTRALAHGPGVREMIEEGRLRAVAYRAETVARQHLELYHELLA